MRKGLMGIIGIGMLLLSLGVQAQEVKPFNPVDANKTLDQLGIRLSVTDVSLNQLRRAVATLDNLQKQAQACVEKAGADVDAVTVQLKEIQVSDVETKTSDQKFLEKKLSQLGERRAACRLFVLRSEEALSAFRETVGKLEASQRLQVSPNILENLRALPKAITAFKSGFDLKKSLARLKIQPVGEVFYYLLAGLVFVFLIAGLRLERHLARAMKQPYPSDFGKRLTYVFLSILHRYSLPLAVILSLALWSGLVFLVTGTLGVLFWVAVAITTYLLVIMTIQFFFTPPNQIEEFHLVPVAVAKPLANRLCLLATLSLTTVIVYLLIHEQGLPDAMRLTIRTLFMTLFSINLMSIVWLINKIPKLVEKFRFVRLGLSLLLALITLNILTTEWLGYHRLTEYILINIAKTIGITLIALALYNLVKEVLSSLSGTHYPWQHRLRFYLGLKKNQQIAEVIWLKLGTYIIIWLSYGLAVVDIWGLTSARYEALLDAILNGFTLVGIPIVPSRIILAIFTFALLSLVTRAVRTNIGRRTGPGLARGVRNSLAAIAGYIGFTIALIFSLLIAGVNFAGLAIIAGALSVGIGFGLQSIVNNFVSGIILLLERPIKIGDRIVVGQIDGHVKSINIRSTVIHTRERTDVIIPNAELIAGQVNNLMFGDPQMRLSIFVGVAYGSDTALVKETLEEIAAKHSLVVVDEVVQPLALFNRFGDSALEFELRVIMRDVDKRQIIRSELHFAIDEAFRKHQIEIAFPQLDLHVRALPPANLQG